MDKEHRPAHSLKESRLLYVVLQGEFALFHEALNGSDHDRLWIMAPEVPDHTHKYMAGPWSTDWCNSPELPRNRLRLRHIHGEVNNDQKHCGRAAPENNADIFMKLGREKLCPEGARVVITAPMPLAILPGRLESTPSVVITVNTEDGPIYPPVPPNPTVIPILVYKWYDGNRPDLFDEQEQCSLFSSDGPSDELQSIQIYASSPSGEHGPSAKCHAQMAFKESAKLLGVDATVDWIDEHAAHNKGKAEADQTPAFLFEYATPPPGLAWAQVNFFLADVLQLTAEERYCETPFPPPASVKVGSSGNCGPITG